MKTKVLGGKKAYESHFKDALVSRESFVEMRSGSVVKILKEEECYTFLTAPKKGDNKIVLQCCKEVKNSAKEFVNKSGVPIEEDYFIPTEYTEFESLKSSDIIFSIDVKSCYWRSAYLLGIISAATYLKYLPNKLERNKAIGCLRRKTEVIKYSNGVEIDREVRPNPLALVNTYIKSHIYNIFNEAKQHYTIYYYHTDEFWTNSKEAFSLKSFLKNKGFKVHVNHYQIVEIQDKGIVVYDNAKKCTKFVRRKYRDNARQNK